jgi:hypothetical protein
MMLASMLEELMQDQDFLDFIAGEVEVEEVDEDMMDEDMDEDEGPMVEPAESMMNRRNTLLGAM